MMNDDRQTTTDDCGRLPTKEEQRAMSDEKERRTTNDERLFFICSIDRSSGRLQINHESILDRPYIDTSNRYWVDRGPIPNQSPLHAKSIPIWSQINPKSILNRAWIDSKLTPSRFQFASKLSPNCSRVELEWAWKQPWFDPNSIDSIRCRFRLIIYQRVEVHCPGRELLLQDLKAALLVEQIHRYSVWRYWSRTRRTN